MFTTLPLVTSSLLLGQRPQSTTLDPAKRTLVRVTLDEVDLAKKLVFQLMESKEASGRREFLEKHGGN